MAMHAVNIGMNKYCGPAVLSILTGKSTDDCARIISSVNGHYKVEGVKLTDLLTAASRLGFDNKAINPAATLYGTLTRLVNDDGLYIVSVPGHFVAIEVSDKKIYFCDNHTKEPMPAASSARLLQKCLAVNKVFKRREPIKVSSKMVAQRTTLPSGTIEVLIKQHLIYDMPEHNRTLFVAQMNFTTELELNDFIETMAANDE